MEKVDPFLEWNKNPFFTKWHQFFGEIRNQELDPNKFLFPERNIEYELRSGSWLMKVYKIEIFRGNCHGNKSTLFVARTKEQKIIPKISYSLMIYSVKLKSILNNLWQFSLIFIIHSNEMKLILFQWENFFENLDWDFASILLF